MRRNVQTWLHPATLYDRSHALLAVGALLSSTETRCPVIWVSPQILHSHTHHLKHFNLPYQCPNETFILWAFIVRSPARKTD